MDVDLNKRLIADTLANIPKNIKPVVYLSNVLDMSRESAYRRLRGEIPFTLQEVVALAINLGFSLDIALEEEKQNNAFLDLSKKQPCAFDFFTFMLKKYEKYLEKISTVRNLESVTALNSILPPFCSISDNLFKFTYYKWLYQDSNASFNQLYANVILPGEILVLQKKIKEKLFHSGNNVFILDNSIFLNLMEDIRYFYHRKLINEAELLLFKKEVLLLIDKYDEITKTGIVGTDAKVQFYLSSLRVNSNVSHDIYDDKMESHLWVFTIGLIAVQDITFNQMQKKWLNSLKRQSALITQSNEIMQVEFFSQQREYAETYLSVAEKNL
jgi:hypothetical protein